MVSCPPSVAIVLVNFNGAQDSVDCLASLAALHYPRWFAVVVDNASVDDSLQRLRGAAVEDPRVNVVEHPENVGYAAGNNIGMRRGLELGADYLWLLNNDTFVDPGALDALVAEAERSGALVGSAIFRHPERHRVWAAGGRIEQRTPRASHLFEDESASALPQTPFDVDYLPGCSLLLSEKTLQRLDFMPEWFFLYYEDTAWCEIARSKGLVLRCVPDSIVYHKVSSSTGEFSPRMDYFISRASVIFARRFRRTAASVWFVLRHHVLNHLCKGRFARFAAGLRGAIDGLGGRLR